VQVTLIDTVDDVQPLSRSFRLLFAGLAIATLLLAACSKSSSAAGPAAAAVVNGGDITQAQLEAAIPEFKFLAQLNQSSCGQASGGVSAETACAQFTLSNLIQQRILDDYAKANGIKVDPNDVTTTLQQLETQLGGAAALDKMLKTNGMSRDQLNVLAANLLVFQAVQKHIGDQTVSDEKLQAAYDQQKSQFTTLDAKHILVKTKQQAEKIAKQATSANFSQLARKYSTDAGSAKNGGDLGSVPVSQLDPTFAQAALALKPGQISQPVQTQLGWHVIELVSTKVQPLSAVRDQIISALSQSAFSSWFQQQLQKATVKVNPRYGAWDETTRLVQPHTTTATGSVATPTPSSTSPAPVATSPTSPASSSGSAPTP
jgi:foldase protein PrsA